MAGCDQLRTLPLSELIRIYSAVKRQESARSLQTSMQRAKEWLSVHVGRYHAARISYLRVSHR